MSSSTKASVKTGESKTGKTENSSTQANKTNFPPLINSSIDQISFLQRTVGNREVERLLKSGVIQAKLTIGQSGAKPVFQPPTTALPTAPVIQTKLKIGEPNHKLEEEADHVAELRGSGGGSILPSAVARNRSPVESRLQMRNGSGGPPAPSAPLRPSQSGILQRKCACGGAAGMSGECEECSKKKRLGLQTKLKVNEPGDEYEQEADRASEQVTATPAHPGVSGAPPRVQRLSGQSNGQMDATPASVDQALASPGRPLEPALRQDMEQRFGYDFSMVRVHSGAAAEQSARDVNAHAYTVGHDIVFDAGVFTPGTHEGRRLIAHELTHVIQQHLGHAQGIQRQSSGSEPDDLYPINHKSIAGMGPGDRIAGRHLFEWARAKGYARVVADSTLRAMQEKPGIEEELVDDIYVLLVERLWGNARDPETGAQEADEFEGSPNARGNAVIELGMHWDGEVGGFLRKQMALFFEREVEGAYNRTPHDASLELRPDVISRIRKNPYGHTANTGRWDDLARTGKRYGAMHIADIYNPINEGDISPLYPGSVWFFLSGHPSWFYEISTTSFLAKDPFVTETYAQVSESTKFAAELFPLMIKVGAFGMGMSARLAYTIGSIALDELGEEGLREARGERHRSAGEIFKSAAVGLFVAHVMNRVFGGGNAAKESAAGSKFAAALEDRTARAVRREVAATEAPQVAAELRAGRARAVEGALRDEGYVTEVDIVSEGQLHTYRETKDGIWCRFTRRMCFEPEEATFHTEEELKELGGYQHAFEGPLGDIVSDPLEAGNLFNKVKVPKGAHAEVQLRTPSGRRPRVDLYVKGKEIISRKFPMGQLANDELKALDYLQELYTKYPPRAPIRSSALQGEVLEGIQVLEIPVQHLLIPEQVLKYAKDRHIVIRDIEGKVYNP